MKINKRLVFFIISTIFVALYFWIVSRYPALNDKASMMREAPTYDILTLSPWFKYSADDPFFTKVFYTTLNWYNSNWRGMLFGLILSALFLAIAKEFKIFRTTSKSPFKERIKGLFVGMPLGLCVNCATPVASTIYRTTGSLQYSLTVLLSSPTLNIVVLGMVISMFPIEIYAPKIILTLVLIFAVVPFLNSKLKTVNAPYYKDEEVDLGLKDESFLAMLGNSLKNFFESFYYVIKTTLPIMLLTGFLAGLLIHSFPVETLLKKSEFTILSSFLMAIIGTLLPLPVAVDVLVAQSLFAAGFSPALVSVFLFTLGSFSIYPLLLLGKEISKKLSIAIFVIVVLFGVIAGFTTDYIHGISTNRSYKTLQKIFATSKPIINDQFANDFSTKQLTNIKPIQKTKVYSDEFISIYSSNLETKLSPNNTKPFERKFGSDIGLNPNTILNFHEMIEPITYGRGIASGDINQDGWTDLIFATRKGVEIYLNTSRGNFTKIALPTFLTNFNTIEVALIDFYNSGYPDIYFTTLNQGPFLIKNDKNNFQSISPKDLISLPHPNNSTTMSTAFGDINHSGKLSIYQGNWYFGIFPTIPVSESANYILQENNNHFSSILVSNKESGATLTTAFIDLNNDHYLDIYDGNDFYFPDQVLLNNKNGHFKLLNKKQTFFEASPRHTMSIDWGDIYNNGTNTFFVAGISDNQTHLMKDECKKLSDTIKIQKCSALAKHNKLDQSVKSIDEVINLCKQISIRNDFGSCLAVGTMYVSINLSDKKYCDGIPSEYDEVKILCSRYFNKLVGSEKVYDITNFRANFFRNNQYYYDNDITQKKTGNALTVNINDTYKEKSKVAGIENTGWTWNSKFADLNNDGYLDLYVANGFVDFLKKSEEKYFFLNQGNGTFKQAQKEFNLDEKLPFSAYTYIDINNSGKLDIITNSTVSEPFVFFNHSNLNGIEFELTDFVGNRSCIGCEIKIIYGDKNDLIQTRTIKASGGFLSFDAPIAHFGLGNLDKINKVEITWSTGERTSYDISYQAGKKYFISRKKLSI